jgi:hypothetical protein
LNAEPLIVRLGRFTVIGGVLAVTAAAIGLVACARADEDPPPAVNRAAPTPTLTVDQRFPTDAMFIGGDVWVNATGAYNRLVALIDGVECASTTGSGVVDGYGASFYVSIPAASVRPGCGVPGSTIQFLVDGELAPQTAVWQPGSHPPIVLRIGPEFAQYVGRFTYSGFTGGWVVQPLIDGVVCGGQINPAQGVGEYGFHIVVLAEETRAGCGRAGAVVTFRLMDTSGEVAVEIPYAFPTAVWETSGIVKLPDSQE